jgi:hypothetical protein
LTATTMPVPRCRPCTTCPTHTPHTHRQARSTARACHARPPQQARWCTARVACRARPPRSSEPSARAAAAGPLRLPCCPSRAAHESCPHQQLPSPSRYPWCAWRGPARCMARSARVERCTSVEARGGSAPRLPTLPPAREAREGCRHGRHGRGRVGPDGAGWGRVGHLGVAALAQDLALLHLGVEAAQAMRIRR